MSVLVKRGDEVIELPDCFCIREGEFEVHLWHPDCPTHARTESSGCRMRGCRGHQVALPDRLKPGE